MWVVDVDFTSMSFIRLGNFHQNRLNRDLGTRTRNLVKSKLPRLILCGLVHVVTVSANISDPILLYVKM